MENHHHNGETKVILSMNISCCDRCPKILKKKLLKMPGVNSVSIDMENDIVQVIGSLDPMTLLNNVAKLGKRVQLLPNDGRHHNNNNNNKQKPKVNEENNPCGGPDHLTDLKPEKKKEEEPHKCEAYEPPNISERVCRDYYCKVHPRGRKIVDKVSSKEGSSFLFGGMPHYWNGGGGFGPHSAGSSYMNPMWYGIEPPMYDYNQPQMYDYHQQQPQYGWNRQRMLPRPFGLE